ncbi:hypothetical protein QFZ27_004696 [Inquilinus ginsengisoli]|jgi:hypothetical protein|uniref:hypothetical protein n=1 Tax=Inquilinus ginsengisoli TaxID=363840 RepID=UPI003D2257E6
MTHRPDHALEDLLDALEAELAAAPEDEIRQAAAKAGRNVSYNAWDVRGVIRRAEAALSPAAPAAPVPRPWLPPPRWH